MQVPALESGGQSHGRSKTLRHTSLENQGKRQAIQVVRWPRPLPLCHTGWWEVLALAVSLPGEASITVGRRVPLNEFEGGPPPPPTVAACPSGGREPRR